MGKKKRRRLAYLSFVESEEISRKKHLAKAISQGRPVDKLQKVCTQADWNLGRLELKRIYNKITKTKTFDFHTGYLLIRNSGKK